MERGGSRFEALATNQGVVLKGFFSLVKVKSASGVQVEWFHGRGEFCERHHHIDVIPYEMIVKVGKAQNLLQLFQGLRFRPLYHHPDLFRVHSLLSTLNYIPKETY